jgi:hypothetical protein
MDAESSTYDSVGVCAWAATGNCPSKRRRRANFFMDVGEGWLV